VRKVGVATPGRFELVALTQTGRALLASDPMTEVVEAIEGLSAPDRHSLAVALEAIVFRLQDADGDDGLTPEA